MLSAADVNELAELARTLGKLSVSPPLVLTDEPGGYAISLPAVDFLAVLCDPSGSSSSSSSSSPGCGHGFKEVECTGCGQWRVKGGGKSAESGAFEQNGIPTMLG